MRVTTNVTQGLTFLRATKLLGVTLELRCDVDRDIAKRLLTQVQSDLREKGSFRINLFHAPGAGGTTVARRLIWEMHTSYPCGILSSSEPRETIERLQRIVALTEQPVLILADGSEVSSGELDELSDYIKARHLPVVIVQVLRSFKLDRTRPQNARERRRTHLLYGQLSDAECKQFAYKLSREAPSRAAKLQNISKTLPDRLRTPFYYCLQAFGEDFTRLDYYVETRLAELTDMQKEILAYLSIAHRYGQKSIPAQLFAHLLGLPQNRKVDLSVALSDKGLDLVVELEQGEWRTAHDLIAQEILKQVLWPSSNKRENWRQNLSNWAVKFARFSRGNNPEPSDSMLELARRTLVLRGNVELLGTETATTSQFAPLIHEIPVEEGKLKVLLALTKEYPEEPHFWAHLGRFYARGMRRFLDAVDCVDRALSLQPDDAVLHHMKGVALRSQAESLIEQQVDLPDVIRIAKQACESFEISREKNPDSEHGYISEVELIIRVLDYAGRQHPQGPMGYMTSPKADQFVHKSLERSEDLLEQVRRNREGGAHSQYEQRCRGKLDRLYGRHENALQVWNNLLTNKEVYSPPIRRQIVRTYLARRGRSWDALSERELIRTAQLLEENLVEEPSNDPQYANVDTGNQAGLGTTQYRISDRKSCLLAG